jgi:transcriptional regulator with XRE-family HTH domain
MIYAYADCISLSWLQNAAMSSINQPDLETLGGRVQFLRETEGWSGAELARQSGFSQPTISDLENNKIKEVSARLVWAVAEALETTPDYLWTGNFDRDEAAVVAAFRKLPPEQRPPILRALGIEPPPEPPTGQAAEDQRHMDAGQAVFKKKTPVPRKKSA